MKTSIPKPFFLTFLKSLFYVFLLLIFSSSSAVAQDWLYHVQSGDNLWKLSKKHLVSMSYWKKLQTLNNIKDPLHLPPGSTIKIPIAWLKSGASVGQITALAGNARITDNRTGQVKKAEKNMILWENDSIQTGVDGNVTLQFADGSKVQVLGNSELKIGNLTRYGATGLAKTKAHLEKGRTQNKVKRKSGSGSRFEISTPSAIAAVRGTEYRISADEGGESKTEVIKGEVGVESSGVAKVLPKGFGMVSYTDKAPLEPTRLLDPPDLTALQNLVDRIPFALPVAPVNGAISYRLQIADNQEFDGLVFDSTFSPGTIYGPDIPDGEYFLRIRGIDENGIEGMDSMHAFVVDAHPLPPMQIEPVKEALIQEKTPVFRWSEPYNVSAYRFQLAEDERFQKTLIDKSDHRKTSLTLPLELAPGVFFWRVASINKDGKDGPFSDPLSFRRPLPGPDISKSELDTKEMAFRWRKGQRVQKYRCQISSDTEFNNIIADEIVTEPEYSFKDLAYGSYYIRVASIDIDGYEGPFSPYQKADIPAPSWIGWLVPSTLLLLIAL